MVVSGGKVWSYVEVKCGHVRRYNVEVKCGHASW